MLTEDQITRVWEHMLAAEVRTLYFADLAATYTRRKQWIAGLTFFLSSGAAATLLARLPIAVPLILAIITAAMSAYTIAGNLDAKIATMAKLHAAWHVIATQYDQLWNHVWLDDAEDQLHRLLEREREPSELAVTTAPHDERRLGHWQDRVLALHHLTTPV